MIISQVFTFHGLYLMVWKT